MASENEQQNDRLVKVRDVAEMFDVEPATVREWLKNGDLVGIKIGRGHYWRIPLSEVKALANRRHGSESQYD